MDKDIEIADLHIHSRYSRATSKDISLDTLSHWGKIKGLSILGTGDFTHPLWLKELKEKLNEIREGIYEYKGMKFILEVEVNNVFEKDGKTRKVHNVILARSFEIVDIINEILSRYGDLKEDGRPTLMLACEEMMEKIKENGLLKDVMIIPAHAWTPWFGVYGSKSGFNSLKECFGKYTRYIFAIETGLSSDPDMNGMVKETRELSLVSNSDAHSYWPWRLGREANIFQGKDLTFDEVMKRIKEKELKTIEVDPAYGKYHYDGHRKCDVSLSPEESEKIKNICPVCNKPLTLGVLHRVYDLKDKEDGKHQQSFYKLLPLHEIISLRTGKGINTQEVWGIYNALIRKYKNELNILLFENISLEDKELENLIMKNREGKIYIKPGYDGVYGVPMVNKIEENNTIKQKNILAFVKE